MKRICIILGLSLAFGGCASLPDLVNALSADRATACLRANAFIYGNVVFCRSNAGAGSIAVRPDGTIEILHRGTE